VYIQSTAIDLDRYVGKHQQDSWRASASSDAVKLKGRMADLVMVVSVMLVTLHRVIRCYSLFVAPAVMELQAHMTRSAPLRYSPN
jgi:hypothetical protein